VYAIAADATGTIWAAIETKVVKFDSAGLQLAVYDHGATVHGIACDGDGNVYLCGDEAE
jgi:sugar lactone lactonase YvrE